MLKDGAGSRLADRLRSQMQSERHEIESVARDELTRLASCLHAESETALRSMKSSLADVVAAQIMALSAEMRQIEARQRRWPAWTALGCSVIIVTALALLWSVTAWLRSDLESLRAATAHETAALERLKASTHGLDLQSATEGTFLILPAGFTGKPLTPWTCGGRACLKLD